MTTFANPVFWLVLASSPLAWKLLGRVVYRQFLRHTTVMEDAQLLSHSRGQPPFAGSAIVAGGSMAGLLTARVLSDHFEKVIIIEPDTVLEEKRGRVPQWNQIHIFLPVMLVVLRRLFVGFDAEAKRAGLLVGPADYNLQIEGKTIQVNESQLPDSVTCTRLGMETLLRRLVHQRCANVTFMTGTVTGLVANVEKSSLVAARVLAVENGKSQDREMPLAFFADCTGPTCGAVKWLPRANAAWGPIIKESYDPKVSYSTVIVPAPPSLTDKFTFPRPFDDYRYIKQVFSSEKSGIGRGYGMSRIEGDRLIAGCNLWGQPESTPGTINDMIDFCQGVDAATSEEGAPPGVLDALRAVLEQYDDTGSPPVPSTYIVPDIYHMHYELSKNLPGNFVACGDSFMRLNPNFGQGCAKAAMDVTVLDSVLRSTRAGGNQRQVPEGTGLRALQRQALIDRPMFDVTRWIDYQHVTTIPVKGETLADGTWFRAYFKAVLRLAHKDPQAGVLFWKTLTQVEPSALLMQPSFFVKVIWNSMFGL